MLVASTFPVMAIAPAVLAEATGGLSIPSIMWVGGLAGAGVLALVGAILRALHLARPSFLTGWSVAGNLCIVALIALMWLQPLIVHRSQNGSLPPSTFKWLPLVWLGLLLASVVLQGRGFFRHRKVSRAH